jgi:hypothetical protein
MRQKDFALSPTASIQRHSKSLVFIKDASGFPAKTGATRVGLHGFGLERSQGGI